MNILITGRQGLAKALSDAYSAEHSVTMVSRSTGHDINHIDQWGSEFLDFDCVFNCAYDGLGQVHVLEFFYSHWKTNAAKSIVTIGSRIICYPRSDHSTGYWPYQLHKKTLQDTHDAMQIDTQCSLKIINAGPIDTAMVSHLDVAKFDTQALAQKIKHWAADTSVRRIDCWI